MLLDPAENSQRVIHRRGSNWSGKKPETRCADALSEVPDLDESPFHIFCCTVHSTTVARRAARLS